MSSYKRPNDNILPRDASRPETSITDEQHMLERTISLFKTLKGKIENGRNRYTYEHNISIKRIKIESLEINAKKAYFRHVCYFKVS